MARRSSRSVKPKAQPCKLRGCKRTVRPDNPTFPYCHDHYQLKDARSSIVNLNNYSMEYIRETLYNPERTIVPRANFNVSTITNNSYLKNEDVVHTYLNWAKISKENNIDTSNPIQAFDSRDFMISSMEDQLKKDYDIEELSCSSGGLYFPGAGRILTDDHKILLCKKEDEFVLDVATSAPLHKIEEALNRRDKTISDYYESGELTNLDGFNATALFQYSHFSTVTFGIIKNSHGETISENNFKPEDSEIAQQRSLSQKYSYTTNQPSYIRNSFIEKFKQSNQHDVHEDILHNESDPEDLSLEDILNN